MLKLDKKTWIIIAIIVLLIIVIVIIVITNKKEESSSEIKGAVQVNPLSSTGILNSAGAFKAESFPLAVYMKGQNCLRLQKVLNKKGYTPKLTEDGVFGTKTETALLSIYNTKTATEDQLNQWEKDVANVASAPSVLIPDTSTSSGLNDYVGKLYQDLNNTTYYMTSRDESTLGGIYQDLLGKNTQEFTTIYNMYKSKYSRDLASDIDSAKFSFTTSVDSDIVVKAKNLNLTTI